MAKVWNIGNTTVRNPKRIENALKVFVEEGFSGNSKGEQEEKRLHLMLRERGILDFDGEPKDINGRKWRAAFYQLGFISYEEYKINGKKYSVQEIFKQINDPQTQLPYQITLAGRKLINATTVPEIEEIYTRQFCCYEIPTLLESAFPEGNLKPFILFLQVLRELDKQGHSGLDKFETGFFLQPFQNHTPLRYKEIVSGVLNFRKELNERKDRTQKKELYDSYLKQLEKISGIDPKSVVGDYADTTFRYFNLSGLLTTHQERIVIRPTKLLFVDELIKNEPVFYYKNEPLKYFELFYSNSYKLPTDNIEFAIQEIKELKVSVRNKENVLFKEAEKITDSSSIEIVKDVRQKLNEYYSWEREEEYALHQQTPDAIQDIIRYLKTLNRESVSPKPDIKDDMPAYLEWAVWRSFLAINDISCKIHQTRRFPIDQDFLPRNTAPGGGSDLIFEFKDYVLVVEVTMTTSHRQMAVESEPVRRHAVQYKEQFSGKDTYCLFIAPEVDNNVAETFRIGVWYKGDDQEFLNIVPMTIGDFNKIIEALLIRKYTNQDFRNLLDKCLVPRNLWAPQWKKSISKEVEDWVRKIGN